MAAGHRLTVAFPSDNAQNLEGEAGGIKYITFPHASNDYGSARSKIAKNCLKEIINNDSFDVIHVWGTEFLHSRLVVEAATESGLQDRVAVSVQGIAKECALHYYTGVDYQYIKKQCLVDIIRKKSIYLDMLDMHKRAENEDVVFKKATNIIGRTDFDRRYTYLLNENVHYYTCNETLRECFYSDDWTFDNCCKNTIFISQATYPLKGLHHVLRAIGIVKKYIPDIKLIIAGGNILEYKGKHPFL
ncbi:MAG: hypothetical protein J6I80_04110, partial [Clostridia bacterium]|nr:hypothetical protein [Clostridia bacterium]